MRKDAQKKHDWSGNLETLEERLAMSADPLGGLLGGAIEHHAIVEEMPAIEHHSANEEPPALDHHLQRDADFWIDSVSQRAFEKEFERIEQSLSNAHDQSGLTEVRNDYGFDGTGQTVAVIDSGIAYDHFALGGGLGANYRVVGGWDFTGENDADPYDDGGAGSHGTHVSGIVGASGGDHEGVAPGVDLVGLRVFDDAGNGYFSWVENALMWVHNNHDSFENPITAVNLSLGVATWNDDAIPSWANLENEFNLLKQDGIFVSVSAGNSYTSYNEPGLSYPAASPHVVPVASVDDSGLLSYYSQRNSRVIAAPGRGIISTVPDYKGNNNGVVDDYASFSGTSMAAPYVAGASVIIREAMEFVGQTNITQQTIYDHMIDTAESFYDSATDAYYNRLDLDAAIDALIPEDDFGSSLATAHDLGTLGESESISGLIGTLDDSDYFSFTASESGTVSFSATGTHNFVGSYTVNGATGTFEDGALSFTVSGGNTYTVAVESANGLGFYDAELSFESSAPIIVKTDTAANGDVYTLDSDNWLFINGNRLWSKTQDFDFAPNTNFIWQGTSGILQRHSGQGWQTYDFDTERFETNAKSKIYSMGEDNMLNVNGVPSWGRTHDFHVVDNMDLFWHGDTGLLQKLENGGSWSTVDTNVEKFATRSDGVAYALTTDGNVTVDGVQTWSGINNMYQDGSGNLILQGASTNYTQTGSFFLGSELALGQQGSQQLGVASNGESSGEGGDSGEAMAIEGAGLNSVAALQVDSGESATAKPHFNNFGRSAFSQAVNRATGGQFAHQRAVGQSAFAAWGETTEAHDLQEESYEFAAISDEENALDEVAAALDSAFDQLGNLAS